ncbi:ABC transporter substrate-binding protein [Paenibacillus sp. UNC451MF]|uniref:ABC transporter substrate-binding protein n=1 Tax=Paenibacillus sp. UNC451MF TaxID=1449063 RepID=UPI00048CEF17|nr:extracellular solute-binding protein [Paenibacillus sp. UNC451MF]
MFSHTKVLLSALLLSCSFFAGCSSGSNSAVEPTTPPKNDTPAVTQAPVTIQLYARTLLLNEDFEKYIQKPLKEKFPYVTINKIDNEKGKTIQDLLTAGQVPDLIWEGLTNIQTLTDLNLPLDLDPLVKKHAFDLNRIDPQLIKSVRSYSSKGQLIYLPFREFAFGLHYNKDIFDKFGVEYPKANMTWDQAVELARKVTGTRDGVNYRGLHSGISINRIQTQMSLPYVDTKTEKSLLGSNDRWQALFRTFKDIYSIPGNWPAGSTFGDGRKAFLETRNLAMFPHLILIGDADFADSVGKGLNWGITTFPAMKDKPGVGPGVFSDGFIVPDGGKNQDLVFQLIAHLLSDEVQSQAAKLGNPTALVNPEVKKKLYESNPLAKGVDLAPVLALKSADPFARTPYDAKAQGIAQKYLEQYFTDKADLNEALRVAEDEMNKMIDQEKLSRK